MEQNQGNVLALSRAEARGLMLHAQGLLYAPAPDVGPRELQATIERLGVVQIDTISVVERAQYLVLWSRLGPYDRDAAGNAALPASHRLRILESRGLDRAHGRLPLLSPSYARSASSDTPQRARALERQPRMAGGASRGAAGDTGGGPATRSNCLSRFRARPQRRPHRSLGLAWSQSQPPRPGDSLDHRRVDGT